MMTSLLIAGGSAIALGVVTELLTRRWMAVKGPTFVHRPHASRSFQLSSEALPDLPSHVRFRANADGERADPVPADPEGTLRVLVAGGSAAECYMLDQDTMWSTRLQVRLAEQDGVARPVHVGNVARSLIACRQIEAVLARALPRFRSLDAIVLMVGASDLVSWFEARTPDRVEDGSVDVTRYCEEHPIGPFRWTIKGSAMYRLIRRAAARFGGEEPPRKGVGHSLIAHRAMRARAQRVLDEAPDPAPMLDSFERNLRALIETCQRHAQKVVVARQPWLDRELDAEEQARLWNFGEGSPYRGEVTTYYSFPLVRSLMAQVDEVARRTADDLGVTSVDLRTAVPSDFEHYYDFLHFTPAGAERVAQALAPVLADSARP